MTPRILTHLRDLVRIGVTALVAKCGQFWAAGDKKSRQFLARALHANRRGVSEHRRPATHRNLGVTSIALTPEQQERARRAMEDLHRVCARCEHCTPAGICTCPASDQYGKFVQSMSRCMCWAEREELHLWGDASTYGRARD